MSQHGRIERSISSNAASVPNKTGHDEGDSVK